MEVALANASLLQLFAAVRKKLWAKTVIRFLIKLYGGAAAGAALALLASYASAKKKDVKGKTVLITGGAAGLGKAMVQRDVNPVNANGHGPSAVLPNPSILGNPTIWNLLKRLKT